MHDPGPRWSVAFTRTPWATLLPLLILLPFMLSGAVRFTWGTTFPVSLAFPSAVAVILVGVAYVYGLPTIQRAEHRWTGALIAAMALLATAFTFELWWTPLFGGLPNTFEGVDLGNHILIYRRFRMPGQHDQYAGMVVIYAIMHWWRVLFAPDMEVGTASWFALRFTHYVCLMTVPMMLPMIVYPVLARIRGTVPLLVSAVASLPVQLLVLGFLIFPVVSYYQAEGFYAQIVGFYPLLYGWLSYALIESALARMILCCVWLVVMRFTYGLNIGDTLFTLAYLWLFEARELRPRWLRWGGYAFVPVAFAGGVFIAQKAWELRDSRGYFIAYNMAWVIAGMALMSFLLLSAPSAFKHHGITVSRSEERLWRYAGIHGVVAASLMGLYWWADGPMLYYIQKYPFYATLMLAFAWVGPTFSLVDHMIRQRGWLREANNARFVSGSVVLGGVALFVALHGYVAYRPFAAERWHHVKPSVQAFSQYEHPVQVFIEKTVREQKKPFGGYYDTFWPRMFTHNTMQYLFSHERDHVFNMAYDAGRAVFLDVPGKCYFVQGQPSDYRAGAHTDMGRQLSKFYSRRTTCMTYTPLWSDSTMSVCAACY